MKKHRLLRRVLPLILMAGTANALAAGTPDPGDYVPAPPGATIVALYGQHFRGDKVYDGGSRVADDLGFKLDIGLARVMHYFELGGMPADFEVILPYARQRIDADDYRESGVGNLILGMTLWPKSDEASGRHLGLAAYLSLPTGEKRDDGLAVSEDRYALDIETGYILPLGGAWSLDLIGQVEFYGQDRTTKVKRKPMVRGFAHLSYHLSDATRLAFSVRQTWGMRESYHGDTVVGAHNDTNLMLTWQHQLTENAQVQVQYTRDVDVRSGLKMDGLQTRLAFFF